MFTNKGVGTGMAVETCRESVLCEGSEHCRFHLHFPGQSSLWIFHREVVVSGSGSVEQKAWQLSTVKISVSLAFAVTRIGFPLCSSTMCLQWV